MQKSKIKNQKSKITPSGKYVALEERLSGFGKDVILFCKNVVLDPITRPLVSQIVRSSTSIGANYAEANNSSSLKDFRNKIFIAKKEAQETTHWLAMIEAAVPDQNTSTLLRENQEIIMILQSIANKVNQRVNE